MATAKVLHPGVWALGSCDPENQASARKRGTAGQTAETWFYLAKGVPHRRNS